MRTVRGAFNAMSVIWSNGRWSDARTVRLPPDTDLTQGGELNGVSCARDGYCVAVGDYTYLPDVNFNGAAMIAVMP
jgi:hypothetical protein